MVILIFTLILPIFHLPQFPQKCNAMQFCNMECTHNPKKSCIFANKMIVIDRDSK